MPGRHAALDEPADAHRLTRLAAREGLRERHVDDLVVLDDAGRVLPDEHAAIAEGAPRQRGVLTADHEVLDADGRRVSDLDERDIARVGRYRGRDDCRLAVAQERQVLVDRDLLGVLAVADQDAPSSRSGIHPVLDPVEVRLGTASAWIRIRRPVVVDPDVTGRGGGTHGCQSQCDQRN